MFLFNFQILLNFKLCKLYEECNIENHRIVYISAAETLKHNSLEKAILTSKACGTVSSQFLQDLMNSSNLFTLSHPKT